MCLGIPMKIIDIEGDEGCLDAQGLRKKVNLSFIKNPKIGEYVLVHAGFAIEKVKVKEAKKTLKILNQIE